MTRNDEEGWTLLAEHRGADGRRLCPSRHLRPKLRSLQSRDRGNGRAPVTSGCSSPIARAPAASRALSWGRPSFDWNFLVLPTGQIMATDFSPNIWIYTPSGSPRASWAPTITSFPATVVRGTTYVLNGHQFNGLSQGAAYGDDVQANTNYPIVRVVIKAPGHVFYARTTNPNTMSVAPNTVSSVRFVLTTLRCGEHQPAGSIFRRAGWVDRRAGHSAADGGRSSPSGLVSLPENGCSIRAKILGKDGRFYHWVADARRRNLYLCLSAWPPAAGSVSRLWSRCFACGAPRTRASRYQKRAASRLAGTRRGRPSVKKAGSKVSPIRTAASASPPSTACW
jgi:hypothetical protein